MLTIDVALSSLAVFVPASVALIVAPGPDSLYVLTRSIGNGPWTGLAAALGTCTGILVHTGAAVVGLSAVLRTSAFAYSAMKYAGAVYLIYLGIQTIRHDAAFELQTGESQRDARTSYRRGVAINVLNPKVAVFFLAFLPQFVPPGSNAWLGMVVLGVVFTALTLVYLATLAVVSSRVERVLSSHPRAPGLVRWSAGAVIVGFGVELAASGGRPD